MRIWCALSAHGYGHLAQTAPVLKALHRLTPSVEIRIAGDFDPALLTERLPFPWTLEHRDQDVGLVQNGPLSIDLEGTARAIEALHGAWEERLAVETRAMAAWKPDLVLADIPYLAIRAARDLGLPVVALTSLSWDEVIAAYFDVTRGPAHKWWTTIRQVYAEVDLAIQLTPALSGEAFPRRLSVPPPLTPGTPRDLRTALGVPDDPRPLVLGGLGGIVEKNLPLERLRTEDGFIWLLDLPDNRGVGGNVASTRALNGWSYADLTASVDAMVGKPGYNTVVETAANRIPFIYARRRPFPDEGPLCDWLDRYGRGVEITQEAFFAGAWAEPVREALALAFPETPPALDGGERAAAIILEEFGPRT